MFVVVAGYEDVCVNIRESLCQGYMDAKRYASTKGATEVFNYAILVTYCCNRGHDSLKPDLQSFLIVDFLKNSWVEE